MLPPLTQDRIVRALPNEYPYRYFNPVREEVESTGIGYEIQRYTEEFDNEIGATTAIYQPTTESMVRGDDTPLTEYLGYHAEENDGELELSGVEGERLYDEWRWTTTATGQGEATTPGGQTFATTDDNRARALAFELREFFSSKERLDRSRLNEPGDRSPFEIAVLPEVISGGGDASAEIDDQTQERRTFVVRFNYTLTRSVAVQYADHFQYEVTPRV